MAEEEEELVYCTRVLTIQPGTKPNHVASDVYQKNTLLTTIPAQPEMFSAVHAIRLIIFLRSVNLVLELIL